MSDSIVRKSSLLVKNSPKVNELKLVLGEFASYAAECYGNLTKAVAIMTGKEMLIGEKIYSQEKINKDRKSILGKLKNYQGSEEDFYDALKALNGYFDIKGILFLYSCFCGSKGEFVPKALTGKPQPYQERAKKVYPLYEAGLFDIAPFKFEKSKFLNPENVKTILKNFISSYEAWTASNKNWLKSKQELNSTISSCQAKNENCAYISSAMEDFGKAFLKAYPTFKTSNISFKIKKLFSRRNRAILNREGRLSQYDNANKDVINTALAKYDKLWKGDGAYLEDNDCWKFFRSHIELFKKYLTKSGNAIVQKPTTVFPQLDNIEVAISRSILSLGNNYTKFSIPRINTNGTIPFKFNLNKVDFSLDCYPSKYFGDITVDKVIESKNAKNGDLTPEPKPGKYKVSFKIYANKNRQKEGKYSRAMYGMLKEPELRILPRHKIFDINHLKSGDFDLQMDMSISDIDVKANNGFNVKELNTISKNILPTSIEEYKPGKRQKSSDTKTKTLLKICKNRKLRIMGVDLGLSPLSGYSIQDYSYGKAEEIYPGCKCSSEEISTGYIDSDFPKKIFFRDNGNFTEVPFSNFVNDINELQKACNQYKSIMSQIRKVRDNLLDGNETRVFFKEPKLSEVLKSIGEVPQEFKKIFSSNEEFIAHIKSLPEEKFWRRNEYLHPVKPFICKVFALMDKIKRYEKSMLFREFYKYGKAFKDAISALTSYRMFGFTSETRPTDLDAMLNKYRAAYNNNKDLFIQNFARRLVNKAYENKVAIIVLENLPQMLGERNTEDNVFFSIWAPGDIAKAVENAASGSGIAVGYSDTFNSSEYDSETGDLVYRDKDNMRSVLCYNNGTFINKDAEWNAARNICYIFASRHNFCKTFDVKLTKDGSKAVIDLSQSGSRRKGTLSHFFKTSNPYFEQKNGIFSPTSSINGEKFVTKGKLHFTKKGFISSDRKKEIKESRKSFEDFMVNN